MPGEARAGVKGFVATPAVERFWRHVDRTDDCWLWTGDVQTHGYGRIVVDGHEVKAHRFSWFLHQGSWPGPGLEVCHSCDVRNCVRPDHLFLGTKADNMRDASHKGRIRNQHSGRAVCLKGHVFSEENTYLTPDGRRQCKSCRRARERLRS
jgi:hypothetical protein